jgi:hypothetical protein
VPAKKVFFLAANKKESAKFNKKIVENPLFGY